MFINTYLRHLDPLLSVPFLSHWTLLNLSVLIRFKGMWRKWEIRGYKEAEKNKSANEKCN